MQPPSRSQPEAGPSLGRRARKAIATRQALFQSGLTAFEHRPLGVVSVLDITEASDVAKGVFYLHFRAKDEYLIALWDFVQNNFLAALRARVEPSRSRRARTDAAVVHYFDLIAEAPRECRFWLRMASYFGDELGEPGQMSRLRHDFRRRLAALLARTTEESVTTRELRTATVLDGTSWGLISEALQLDGQGSSAALDRAVFVRAVTSAIRALERGSADEEA